MQSENRAVAIGFAKAVASRFPLDLQLHTVGMLVNFRRFGKWIAEHGSEDVPSFPNRGALYKFVIEALLSDQPLDLLEFGVFRGESMRLWLAASGNPEARLVGFDSFEGLPEKWDHLTFTDSRGHFDAHGEIPVLCDPRVRFVKGLFQDTLPTFLRTFQVRQPLIIHLDADLYSSTLFVLTSLAQYIVPGTFLVFDEFSSTSTSEFRALVDFATAFRCGYRLVARSGRFYDQVCLQVTAGHA